MVACEFGFLAGSIGRAAANRLVDGIHRATAEGIPLLAAPTSGGTRMQEGTPAFVQMIAISAALAAHKAAGLPYLVYLRNPTTGGVMASWGSLGHVTVAEPGALVGFLGPRVFEALYGRPFPDGCVTLRLTVLELGELLVQVDDADPCFPNFAALNVGSSETLTGLGFAHGLGAKLDWHMLMEDGSPVGKTVQALLPGTWTEVT